MTRQSFRLSHDKARALALGAVRTAPEGWEVSISPPKRSLDQNAIVHALIGDIVKSGKEWGGKTRDADTWKTLLVSAHAIATKEPGQVIAGLEGEMVFLRESTARMSKSRSSSLIEYIIAWCASNGIEITDRRDYGW